MDKKYRLAVVNSHPIQYFAPLYRHLNAESEVDITALYGSDFSLRGGVDPGFKQSVVWDVDLITGYRSVFLGENAKKRSPGGFWSLVCPEVWKEVRSGRYDAVLIHGYSYFFNILAVLAAKSLQLPVFLRSETPMRRPSAPFKHKVRDFFLGIAYRHIDGFFAIGYLNREYYKQLGIPEHKVFNVPYTVDNERFIAASCIDDNERKLLKQRFNIPDGIIED
jgi:glycosyltransferase involved in cell wall biosynthesis